MARSLIEEFKLENPQYKDVDDGVFKSAIISDFKSQFPQYKDMGDDFFAPMLNPTEKTTMEKAAKAATDVTNKWWSYFENFNPDDLGSVEGVIGTAKAPFTTKSIDTPDTQRVVKDVVGGAAGTASGMLATIPATMKRLGISDEGENAPFEETAQRLDDFAKRMQPENPNFGDSLASGLASMATFFFPGSGAAAVVGQMPRLGAWAAKLAPLTGVAVSTIMESGTEAGQTYLDAKKEFGDIEAAHMAQNTFLGNVALVGLTNYLGGMFDPRIKGMVRRAFTQATTEGFQEGGQSIIQKVAQGKPIDWGDFWTSVGVGSLTGGGVGLVQESFLDERTLDPETASVARERIPEVVDAFRAQPIPKPKEAVDTAVLSAVIAKQRAVERGADPAAAAVDSLHAFTKTLDPEPLVPQKKKAKGIIEYIKGWGGVDSTKEGGADFAELEIKGLVNDKNGKAPDHLVEKAIEDGFLPEQSTYNDLLALVEREQYSGPVLRQGDEAEGALPERPLDSMSIESLDREIDRFQDMLGQGKAGKSIQLRLADLLEARKRRAQAEAEDMPDWVTEPLEGLEPDITPQKTVSSPTPGQMQGDAELARLARANQVQDDLIVSLVDQIERDDAIIAEDYEGKFDAGEGEVRGVIRHTPGGQFKAIIELARGATRKTARHEFMHFARKNLLDQKQIAVLEDAFQGNQEDEADAFGLYMAEGSAGNSLVDKVFKVLKDFVGRMGNWMKGRGFQTVEDIFKAIDQGKLGKRKSSRVLTPKDIQFSVEPKQIKDVYENSVNDYFTRRRDINLDTPVPVLAWSDILVALKASKAPVVIPAQHLGKARYDHDVAVEDIMKLPDKLRDPVMVFTSGTVSNSYVFLTGLKNTKGKPVAAAIHLDQRMGHGGRYVVHKIATLGDRDLSEISIWLKEGRLRYKNPQKATAWLQSNGLYAAKEEVAPSGTNIAEDKNNVKPQFSVERRAPTFFSAAEVILKEKMPNMASVEQVRAILSGIKQEEVKWLGVEQFLEGKEKVSKAEMLDFVRANQVKVEEVVKGASPHYSEEMNKFLTTMQNSQIAPMSAPSTPEGWMTLSSRLERRAKSYQRAGSIEDSKRYFDLSEEAGRLAEGLDSETGSTEGMPKFAKWQLPGGENYRELLLTLPSKKRSLLPHERASILNVVENEAMDFKSSHFDEPNILAHVRFNERTGTNGERILFLEEVQSDWHQAGREKGYKQGLQQENYASWGQRHGMTSDETTRTFQTEDPRFQQYSAEQDAAYKDAFAVPDAPFKKTWHELALKRMLRYAAENGFDQLAWTTGDIQNDRYDLSKQVRSIGWTGPRAPGSTKTVTIYLLGSFNDIEFKLTPDGKVKAIGEGTIGNEIHGKNIDEVVGKDAARKIMAEPYGELSGDGLKVGGQGMRGFYDQIIPSFLNKYAKKWGGRVGQIEIDAGNTETAILSQDNDGLWIVTIGNETEYFGRNRDSAYRYAKKVNSAKTSVATTVHSLDITPSMKRDVLEVGQVQFSVERKDEPQVGQAIKAISDSIKAKEVGGDYTLGDGETIRAEDLVDSMTLGEVTKEKAAGFLKAVKKGIHFLELPQNYLYAHEDSKPVAEGVIDAFVARERREHDIEEFKRMALSAPNPEALAEIVAAADRDNDINIFAELTKAVKAGKITQADKEAFTKGLYFIHKAAKDQLIRDILASRVGVRIKSMGTRYLASYETKDGKAQERWLTGTQMRALEARGTKITVLEEKEQIRIKRGSPEKGEIIESTRKVSSYDEALSILKEEEKQIIRELLPYRNYIPHARRGGRFWVEAYDQEGQKVYSARVPNESVAARMSELIGKEHPDWRIDAHPHSEKMRITPSFGSMADVQFFMNQNGIDPTSEPGQRIINAYRSVSPLMASLIHSQNIAGYKVDWDSIVDSMALMASSGSGRAYRLDVKDLMDDVKNIKDDFRFNTALQYVNALSEVQEDMPVVLQSIKSLTYFWLLANKSTYVIQNLTEPIWALARIESIKNPAGFAIVLNDEYKALLNRATEEGILKPFFSEQALAMNPLENLQKLDILGRASEVWSSRKVFEIGLRLARDNGLRGNEAYRYAYQFLFNKGKPFYSTANKPIGMLGKGWAVNRQYGFMLLNFMFDWLGKFARGMLRNKLMTLMAWVLLGGFGTLPFGRKLMELFKFQFEKNARNYDLLDRFMLGGVAGMLGISPSFIVPTVLKGIPLPSVNPFRSIDIIGNQIGFAAKSYEKYGIIGASGYLPLAGGQYLLRGQARLKDGFKDNKKIIYRPRTNYEKLLVGAGLNPFEVNEYYRTKENAK